MLNSNHQLIGVGWVRAVWRSAVSWFVSLVMVVTSLPLSVLVPQVAMAAAPSVTFSPADGGWLTSLTGPIDVSFGETVYSDSACNTAMNSVGAGNILTTKHDNSGGVAISHSVIYRPNTNTAEVGYSANDLTEGDVIYLALSNGWYYDESGTCTQGTAHNATVTIDTTAPSAPSSIALESGLNATDNDSTPTLTVTVGETGGSVTLYTDSSCTSANAASSATSVTDAVSPYTVDITATALTEDGAVSYYAKHADAGGNTSACSTATVSYTYDGTAPTVSSVSADGATVTVTMGENIYATTIPDGANFTITRSGGNAPTVSTVAGIPSASGSADNSFTLTLSGVAVSGDTLSYTQSGTDSKIPRDVAGNKLAAFTGQAMTVTAKTITVSDVSTDNYINGTEDENAVLIDGTSAGLTTGTTITVDLDDADAGNAANHTFTATTDATGAWTTADTDLTSARIKLLTAGTWTITASATYATSGTKTVVYDPTAPAVSSIAYKDSATDGSTVTTAPLTASVYSIVTLSEEVKETVSDTATARPDIRYQKGWVGHGTNESAKGFSLDSGNTLPKSMVLLNGYFYVADKTDQKLYGYNTDGTRASTKDINLTSGNGTPTGMDTNGTKLFIADNTVNKVYVYNMDGTFDTSFSTHADNTGLQGLFATSTHLYVVDPDDRKIYVYTTAGTRVQSKEFNLDSSNTLARGIDIVDGYAYVLDRGYTNSGNKVYAYNLTDGSRDTNREFDLVDANVWAEGMALYDGSLYVVDDTTDSVYAYQFGGTEYQYDIIADDGTLATGDCQETGTGNSDGKVYTCLYTGSSMPENTLFKTYIAQYADAASNSGTAQTYSTNSGGVTYATPTAPTLTFSPASGYSTDNTIDITITASAALYADSTGTAFTDSGSNAIDDILTLKTTDENGTDIDFDATISGNTITIDPDNNLAEGVVYVAISDGWYYGGYLNHKIQGSASNASFTVDTIAPTISSIAGGYRNLTVTMSEPVYATTSNGSDFRVTGTALDGTGISWAPNSVTGIPSTVATADNAFKISSSHSSLEPGIITLAYTQNSGRLVKDVAGNTLASVSGVAIAHRYLVIQNFSDGFINDAEEEGAITVTGTAVNFPSGGDIFLRTPVGVGHVLGSTTSDGSGSWSIDVPSAKTKIMRESTPTLNGVLRAVGIGSNTYASTTSESAPVFTVIYDVVAPTISTSVSGSNTDQKTVTASDTDTYASTWKQKLIDGSDTCDATEMASGTSDYTEGANITATNSANGKKYCFSSTDRAGNVAYQATSTLSIANAALTITVGSVPSGSAQTKTINLSSVTTGASVAYKTITGSTCDVTAYGVGVGTSVTISSGSGSVTVNSEDDNTKYLCFKVSKTNFTTQYFASGQITGIDTTVPTISTATYSGAAITLTMSQAVYGDATKVDFTVTDDGSAATIASLTLASAANSASTTVTLTMSAQIMPGSVVTLAYSPGGSRHISDAADNPLADVSSQSVTTTDTAPAVSFTPPDSGYIPAATTPITVAFGETIYSDSACTTTMTDANATFVTLQQRSGNTCQSSTHSRTVAYNSGTVTMTPTGTGVPSAGACAKISNAWYYKRGSTCYQGFSQEAKFSVDSTSPTFSSASYDGTTVTVTMSEAVYGTATKDDFTVTVDGSSATISSITLASARTTTTATAVLTMASAIAPGSTVTVAYSPGGSRYIKDRATNTLSSFSAQSVTGAVTPLVVSFTPADSGYLTSVSGNVTVGFASAVYTDNACTTAMDATGADAIVTLKEDTSAGTDIGQTITYASNTITINPNSDLVTGDVVYAAISNGWYFLNGGSCYRGQAANATITVDAVVPTLSSAVYSGSTVIVTMSEAVYGAAVAGDFKVSDDGTAVTVSTTDLPSAVGSASSTVTLTLASPAVSGSVVKVYYTQNADSTKRVKDVAGNVLASLVSGSALTATEKFVAISAVSTDDYINDTEDESAVLITGTSVGLATNTTVTIMLDDADADTNADHSFTATTNSSGAWTTAATDLTSARIKALDQGAMTIAATADGAVHGTRTVTYDSVVPTAAAPSFTTDNVTGTKATVGDTITVSLDFSEEIDESNTTIKYQVGSGTETTFTYTTDATIDSGECKETTDSTDIYSCKYTVASGDSGLFKTKVSAFKDVAGNSGTAQSYNGTGIVADTAAPTISSGEYGATTVALTMSKAVWGVADADNFTMVNDSGGTPVNVVPTEVTVAATRGAASTTITLTMPETVWAGVVKIYYTQDTDSTKRINDVVGNVVASIVSADAVTLSATPTLLVSAVSTDDYINNTEDESAVLIAGVSTGLADSTTVTITLDDADADTNADHSFTATVSSGTWTTAATDLTSTRIKALDVGDMTITASATGATSSTRTVTYDPTVPTLSSAVYSGTTVIVTMSEGVWAETLPMASDFKVKSGVSGSETANAVTGIAGLHAVRTTADNSFTLTVTDSISSGSSVKVYYTAGTNTVTDRAENALATIAEASAITATETTVPLLSFTPADTAYLTTLSDDLTIGFGETVYKDSSCANSMDATGAGTITVLKVGNSAGVDIANTVSYASNTITINPSADFAEGGVVYMAVTNGWYYQDSSNVCRQGTVQSAIFIADATAPSVVVASTGYYSNSAFTNALSGAVKTGQDIYTKVTLSEPVVEIVADGSTAKPVISYTKQKLKYGYAGSGDVTLDSANTNPQGVAVTSSGIYVVDDGSTTDKVFAYTLDGTRNASADFTLDSSNTSPAGITATTTHFLVVDSSKVYGYTLAGVRAASADFTDSVISDIQGIASDDSHIYLYDSAGGGNTVYAFTIDGVRDSASDITVHSHFGSFGGVKTSEGLFLTDINVYQDPDPVYVYNTTDGSRITAQDFFLAAENDDARGMAQLPNGDLLVSDSADDKLYRYQKNTPTTGTDTFQYNIIGSGETLASEDCKETGTGVDDGKEYSCFYDTTFNDYGSFAVKVGTGTTDVAGNAFASEYTHGTALTLDPIPPDISSAGYGGTTITVSMSEDVWAGTAPTASDFKVKSGVSGSETANVVTGITGLASTRAGADDSFDLTVTNSIAAGSSVKLYYTKGTNAISDEAGNDLATLSEANAVTVTEKSVTISAFDLGSYINASEDDSIFTITGYGYGLLRGEAVSVFVDGSGTDVTKTTTLESGLAWNVSLTAAEVQALDAATPDVDGETITITASAIGATNGTRTLVYDVVAPTISSAIYNASTVAVTMSEDVYASPAPTATDFKVKSGVSGSETANAVTTVTGLPSVQASADDAFDLTVTNSIPADSSVKMYYTTGTNTVTDKAGNPLATLAEASAVAAGEESVTVSAVSTDNYINNAEDESAILITGTSAGFATGTTVTVTLDDADADTNADHSFTLTTDSSGNWTTAATDLTSARIKALDQGAMTITASITGGVVGTVSDTRTVTYDRTAPTATYTVSNTGGVSANSKTYLNATDTVSVTASFNEGMKSTAPTVQFKDGTNNLGSAVTATATPGPYDSGSLSTSASQSKTATQAIVWNAYSSAGVSTKTASFGGTLIETNEPFASLRLRVTIPSGGNTQTLHWKDSDPSSLTDGTGVIQSISWTGSPQHTFNGDVTLTNIPAGRRFWWGSSNAITAGSRTLRVNGTYGAEASVTTAFQATYTVTSSDNVADGSLKYDFTNEASVTDLAGNAMAAKAVTTISNYIVDNTVPTISSVRATGTAMVVTMSENVYGTVDADDFVITGGGAPTVQAVTGLQTTQANADNSFTLTLSSALSGGTPTLAYTQDTDTTKRIKDSIGNALASASSVSITVNTKAVAISTVATDDYINDTEDESAVTISGSSTDLTTGTTVSVSIDGSGTDLDKTGTTNSSGAWSVSLTSAEVKALDAATPNATGETITITATADDAAGDTHTVTYDPIAPTTSYSIANVGGVVLDSKNYLNATDKVLVYAVFNEATKSTAPTVQMKNGSANLGSAITATVASGSYDSGALSTTTSQSKTATQAIAWDPVVVPAVVSKAASFGGTLIETKAAFSTMQLRVAIPSGGYSQKLYWKDSDPSSLTDGTVLTQSISWTGSPQHTFNGDVTLTNIPAGRRFWWGGPNAITAGSRTLRVSGTVSEDVALATYTVGASDEVADGSLKYDFTNEASVTDLAGNAMVAKAVTTISNYIIDNTTPTISSVRATGTAMVVTMSENVYGTVDADDFVITGGGAPTVQSVTGLQTTRATADNSFTLMLSSALSGGTPTLAYTQDGNASKRIKDGIGNALVSASSVSITINTKAVAISTVATDDYINSTEDDSAVTISGSSTDLTTGTTVSVSVDGSGTDVSGKTGTTNSSGNWSVSLTSAEVQALDAATPNAAGETIAITATADDAVGDTHTVTYDPTAPTVTSGSVGYYETFTASTRTLSNAASGAYTSGDDIYTKVVFSEDMTQTAGTGGTAKPVIKYDIAGTETQYEIVAQGTGTLDSGKCRPNHATETDEYVCRYTVGASDTGPFTVIVDTGSTDIATNALASKYTHSTTLTLDTTVPTISSVVAVGTALTVTMSENVYGTVDADNFVITGGGAPTVDAVTGLQTARGSADNSFTLTIAAALSGGTPTLAYTQDTDTSKRVKDTADNVLASASSVSITIKKITISAVATDDHISATEDDSAVTISGSSIGLSLGATVTVVADGSGTDVTKSGTTNADGDWSVSLTSSEVQGLDAATPAANGETITITASATGAESGIRTVVYDITLPTAQYVMDTVGEHISGSTRYLNAGDRLLLDVVFDESMSAAPVVQFKTGSGNTNYGTAITAVAEDAFTYNPTLGGNDGTGPQDPTNFGNPTAVAALVQETVTGATWTGYVYKATKDIPALYARVGITSSYDWILKGRWATSKPTTANAATHGTEFLSANKSGNHAVGSAVLRGVASGTYFWFYPTASTAVSNRFAFFAGASPSSMVEHDSGTLSDGVAANTTSALDFGAVSGSVTREDLGTGKVYRVTEALRFLDVGASATLDSSGTLQARWATSKPAASTLTTHGSALWSSTGTTVAGSGILTAVAKGSYIWFYPTTTRTASNRRLALKGAKNNAVKSPYTATYTIQSDDSSVATGALKYDLTNESSLTDDAGNPFGTVSPTAISGYTIDTSVPTISSVKDSGTTLTVTLSENVYGTLHQDNFVITGGGAPAVQAVGGLQTVLGSADNSFTLTMAAALTGDATLAYTQDAVASRRARDAAGNVLATVSSVSISLKNVSVSAVATDDYISAVEDDSALTISGTSGNLTTGTSITVQVDGSGTDVTKTGTTDADGDWSVSLSASDVQGLDAATPNESGEEITITASATNAQSGTRTVVYDHQVSMPSAVALDSALSAKDADSTPTIDVTVAESGGAVTLYSDSGCTAGNELSASVAVTDTASPFTVAVTANALVSDGAVAYYAKYTDAAGNVSGCSTANAAYEYDGTVPTLSSALYVGTTLTITMSEAVYATTAPAASDFKVMDDGTAITPSAITIASTKSAASVTVVLTVPSIDDGSVVKVYYTEGTNAVFDVVGNELETLAQASAVTAVGKRVAISAVSTDDSINDAEDESAVLIAGTSAGLGSGVAVTVAIDDGDADTNADHTFTATTTSGGAWTTASGDLTSARLKAMEEGTMTITATASGAASGTRSVSYDRTVPTVSSGSYKGTVVTVVLSEAVYGDATKADFTVHVGGSAATIATLDLASAVDNASAVVLLTMSTSIAAGSTVTLAYSPGGSRAVRDAAGNTVAAVSSQSLVDGSVPTAVFSPADGGVLAPATNLTVAFPVAVYSDSACVSAMNGTSFGSILSFKQTNSGGTDIAKGVSYSGNTATIDPIANLTAGGTVYTALTNGWYYLVGSSCYQGAAVSATVTVDGTVPTVTEASTGYYSDSGLGSALSGSVKAGQDIYTKVTFSEVVREVVADDSAARPAISYSKGGTDTQYDIVASDETLVSGDCKEIGTGASDGKVYACFYDVGASDSGSFAVKVGTGTMDAVGNALASVYTHATALTLDTTRPTISSVAYSGTSIFVALSEVVHRDAAVAASDFKVTDDGTAIVPSAIAIASTKSSASAQITLTVPSITDGSTVKVWYTAGTNAVLDVAGNALASVPSVPAVTASEGVVAEITPWNGGYLKSVSGNVTVGFTGAVFTDSACTTAMDATGATGIITFKEDDNSGSAITKTVSYASNTATLDPSSDFSEGDVVYVAVSDAWYYSIGGACQQGAAVTAIVTVDGTAPSVVSGSTDYYGEAAFTNALSGSYKSGQDVYTKVSFSEVVGNVVSDTDTARPDIFYRLGKHAHNAGSGFSLDSENGDPQGVAVTATGIFVLDNADNKVYAYTLAGARNASADFTVLSDVWRGIAVWDGRFYLAESGGGTLYAYTLAGVRDSGNDVAGNDNPSRGAGANTNGLLAVNESRVQGFGGNSSVEIFLRSGSISDSFTGMAATDSRVYAVGDSGDRVYAYGLDDVVYPSEQFALTVENSDPSGMTITDDGDILVVDSADDKVYWYTGPVEERYDMVASGAVLGAGDCQEAGTGSDDGKVYRCLYTVGASDEGLFVVGVGDGITDAAGHTGTEYLHSEALAFDNTAPMVISSGFGFFSNANAGNNHRIGSGSSRKLGDTIYTKVVFSEEMRTVVGDGAGALPALYARVNGVATQYDIVSSGATLASGDCKRSHSEGDTWYVCMHTVGATDNGAFTVGIGSGSVDEAGNAFGSAFVYGESLTLDSTPPTISSANYNGTTVTVTLSEKVWGNATTADFTVTDDGSAVSVSSLSLPSTAATAATSFTLTVGAAIVNGSVVTLAYSPGGSRSVKDVVGNALANVSSQSVVGKALTVPAISGGYVNSVEGAGGLSVSGSSVNIASGTALSVVFDGAGTDVTKTATIGADGSWSVSLSGGELAGLDAAMPDSAGETITVTATADGVSGSQSFIYDPVVPTISIAAVEGDGYVNSTEDDSGITIAGTTVGADSGSDVDIVVSRGIQTTSIADVAVSSNAWTTSLSLANLTALGEGVISITVTVDDTAGNTATTTASFVYDATAPTTTVASVPTGSSNVVALQVSVGGAAVTQYKHKVVAGTACTTGGYGSEVAVATRITDSVSSLSDGAVVLCVIGRDVAGNWQSESAATSASWTKDTVAPSNSAGSLTGPSTTKTKQTISFTGTTDTTAVLAGDYVALYDGDGGDVEEVVKSDVFTADSDGAVDWEVSFSSSTLGKGVHTLVAYYYDAAGNRSTDASPPTASISVKSSGGGGRAGGGSNTVTAPVWGYGDNVVLGSSEEIEEVEETDTVAKKIVKVPIQKSITGTHSLGSSNEEVFGVQVLLNQTEDCKVATSGVGSAGNETQYFGSLTKAAIECYQKSKGLSVTGVLTPALYQMLVDDFLAKSKQQQGTQTGEQQQQEDQSTLPGTYTLGDANDTILLAKQILNTTKCKIALPGQTDSAGNETNVLTRYAVHALRCYQRSKGFAVTGDLTPETMSALTAEPSATAFTVSQQQKQQQEQQQQQQQEEVVKRNATLNTLRQRLADLQQRLANLISNKNNESASAGQQQQESGTQTEGQQQQQQGTQPQGNESISGTYTLGDSDPEIQQAQELLNETVCQVATTGAGSPGNETNYFGRKMQAAITCYQTLRRLPVDQTLTPALYARLYRETG